MVIVHLSAGLGNQMFQYAMYYSFIHKSIPAKIELSAYRTRKETKTYEMERVFGLNPEIASKNELMLTRFISQLLSKLNNHPYKETSEQFGFYNDKVQKIKFGYLKGYWQSEKYFINIEKQLRNQFRFRPLEDKMNLDMEKKVLSSVSVSLHIRRGDYLSYPNWAIDIGYYLKAIQLMKDKVISPTFFVFSDDIPWVQKHLSAEDFKYIDFNQGPESYKDMLLMSKCKHHIIANSSFSWWGAWLNPDPGKIVIAPSRWNPGINGTRDIIPEKWIQLPVN